jgi:UPF0716 protein FxsA
MRLRRGWPTLILVLLVIAVPTFEVWLLVQVAGRIGVWATLAILVLEAVLGGWLMRREGGRAWQALIATFSTGRVPSGELANAALVLVGGVLLILPGFLTDLIGFLFLLPMTRPLARRILAFFIARRISRLSAAMGAGYGAGGDRAGTVIKGETVESPPPAAGQPIVISGEVTEGRDSRPKPGNQPGPSPTR